MALYEWFHLLTYLVTYLLINGGPCSLCYSMYRWHPTDFSTKRNSSGVQRRGAYNSSRSPRSLRIGSDLLSAISVSTSMLIWWCGLTFNGCFNALSQIPSVRRSLPSTALQSLVVSPVLSRLNYTVIRRWQPSQRTCCAACTLLCSPACRARHTSAHCSPVSLHWLRATELIQLRLSPWRRPTHSRIFFKLQLMAEQLFRLKSLMCLRPPPGRRHIKELSLHIGLIGRASIHCMYFEHF